MDYQEIYKQDVAMYNDIVERYDYLQEEDVLGSFQLMKDSIQAYNRWSYIKYDIKRNLKRGEASATKDRLEEKCRYLKEVHTGSRMIWNKAKEGLNNNCEL